MFNVIALGESLIDFTPAGSNELGIQLMARNPGGAPANVLAMNAKLGRKTAFIGKVGADDFGSFLKKTMEEVGINVSGLKMTTEANTTLAFVNLNEKGDRSFSFYRNPGADTLLQYEEVDVELLINCEIFHFGSVSLTAEPSRTATIQSALKAKESGAIISFDPNYRPLLWMDEKHAKREILNILPLADIIKVSEEEMRFLTQEVELDSGAEKLSEHGARLVVVTLGEKGAFFYTPSGCEIQETYAVDSVDTTGAGDAFVGALHHCILEKSIKNMGNITLTEWKQIIKFSNAAGSLTTTKKGAIPAMPSLTAIVNCMDNTPFLKDDNMTALIV